MWMHEHFNLREAPDLVTYSKKMLAGGIYHKVMRKTVLLHNGGFCNDCVTKQCRSAVLNFVSYIIIIVNFVHNCTMIKS
jgi:hypothetical protein